MKRLFNHGIAWKMAWRNLMSQRRRTLLTIAGGCISTALIMASIIFYQSFDESGNRWLKKHYGPIDWELRPPNNNSFFSAEELLTIGQHLETLRQLPAVTFETQVSKVDGNLQSVRKGMRYLGIGLDFSQASIFDPENPLWNLFLSEDQIVLSEAIAKPLELTEGDTVTLTDVNGEEHFFQVKKVVKEEGISGYRGSSFTEGTLLMGLSPARMLAGLSDQAITSIFTGIPDNSLFTGISDNSDIPDNSFIMPIFPAPSPLFEVIEQKRLDFNQVQEMKMKHRDIFVGCSMTAIIAGAVLMIQILLMLADSRKETTAILRAIGFQRKQTQTIFFIEAFLINLLCTGVGILLGTPLGYCIIVLFGWFNRDLLFAYSANNIPIIPYISLEGMLLTGIIVFGLIMLTSLSACFNLGNLNIVPVLRGRDNKIELRSASKYTKARTGVTLCAAMILGIYIVQLVMGKGIANKMIDSRSYSAPAFAFWFVASISLLYLVIQIIPFVQKLLKPLLLRLGIGEAAQILAFRYPAGNYRRTFGITVLFSCCFMLLTLVVIITQYFVQVMEQNPYTILSYPAYIKYETDSEKEQILSILHQDPKLRKIAKKSAVLEPYMIQTASKGAFPAGAQLNLTIPNDTFFHHKNLTLSERSTAFVSDEEAWKAVMNNPQYVILDKKYSYALEEWPGMERNVLRKLNVGDKLRLDVLGVNVEPNTPGFGEEPKVVDSIDIEIIGFADILSSIEFYNIMFVHPQVHEKLKPLGYRWPNTPEKGYIMLPLLSKDMKYLRKIEEQVAILGINGFFAPGIVDASDDIKHIQMMWIYNGFMILSLGIGLTGLAILQYRAVQERSKIIAMMRCIGLSTRLVRQMLVLEGTMIGWIGILNGFLFGTIGGYVIVNIYESYKRPTDPALSFYFPWELMLPIVGTLMLLTLLLNVEPSKRILQLSPSEAIRSAD